MPANMSSSIAEDLKSRFFEHGGRLDMARLAFPSAPEPWIDLSTGISPWAYPIPKIEEAQWHRLPPPSALEKLIASARRAYRAPQAAAVVALPGADLGLCLIPWLFRTSRRVAILGPTYSGHRKAWAAAGHIVSEVASLEEIGRAEIVVVTNPNNPDGRIVPHAELAQLSGRLHRRDGLLVIDEAFADTDPSCSILPVVNRLDRTVVLRSFGKFYGAAGVRLGFAITSHPLEERLRDALGAWPLSAAAIAMGSVALDDEAWAFAQRGRLKEAADKLDEVLAGAGLKVLGGTSLFRLVAADPKRDLFQHLATHGILIRPYLDRPVFRFGLPRDEEEIRRLTNALGR